MLEKEKELNAPQEGRQEIPQETAENLGKRTAQDTESGGKQAIDPARVSQEAQMIAEEFFLAGKGLLYDSEGHKLKLKDVLNRVFDNMEGRMPMFEEREPMSFYNALEEAFNSDPTQRFSAEERTDEHENKVESSNTSGRRKWRRTRQYFTGTIRDLVAKAKLHPIGEERKIISGISDRLKEDAKREGVEIDTDYKHVLTDSEIRHAFNHHGGENEVLRGQIPITDEDFDKIPDIINNYDSVYRVKDDETRRRKYELPTLRYEKAYDDGTIIYLEEVRTGKKELAFKTLYKKKNPERLGANRTNATPIPSSAGFLSEGKGSENSDTSKENGENSQFSAEERESMTPKQIDDEYFRAMEAGDEAAMREMLDEVARRNGYGKDNSWRYYHGAPEKTDYTTDEEGSLYSWTLKDEAEDNPHRANHISDSYYASVDINGSRDESMRAIQDALSAIRRGEDPTVTIYRAVPKNVREGKVRRGDWVTMSRAYAVNHGQQVLGIGNYRIIKEQVPASQLYWDGNDINEWGFDDQQDYRYRNTRNNRKLDDLVTRDDDGNVIPPSKRFNSRNADTRYSAEERDIIDKARKDGKLGLAPNGKPSNLYDRYGEHVWAMVRTPQFKNWFGDWERIEKVRNSDPIRITGKEITPSDDLNEYRKNARAYAMGKLRGEYTNGDTNEKILVNRNTVKETLRHDKTPVQFQSVAAIPQIIENGIYITTLPNEEKEINRTVASYDYYVCGLKIGGEDYTVKAVIATKIDGKKYYDHTLTKIEKGKLISLLHSAILPGSGNNNPLSEVKDKRLISILQNNSSKVVDENGEPLVVYHGTKHAPFTIFERSFLDAGFWFNSDKDNAFGYGDNKYEVFLNMRNPLVVDAKGGMFFNIGHNGETISSYELAQDAELDGYDGLVLQNVRDGADMGTTQNPTTDYVTFSPNQIKSVGNNGDFSTENNDIRYSSEERVESIDDFDGREGTRFSVVETPEGRSLVGIHNITEDKLRKALKLGGLANPSVAVVDLDKSIHRGYGDISLLLPSEKIDADIGGNAGTWLRDAGTPRFPKTELRASEKGQERLREDVESLPPNVRKQVSDDLKYMFSDARAVATRGAIYLFLWEEGKDPVTEIYRNNPIKYQIGGVPELEDSVRYIRRKGLLGEYMEWLNGLKDR